MFAWEKSDIFPEHQSIPSSTSRASTYARWYDYATVEEITVRGKSNVSVHNNILTETRDEMLGLTNGSRFSGESLAGTLWRSPRPRSGERHAGHIYTMHRRAAWGHPTGSHVLHPMTAHCIPPRCSQQDGVPHSRPRWGKQCLIGSISSKVNLLKLSSVYVHIFISHEMP